jgi:hypothetical protein
MTKLEQVLKEIDHLNAACHELRQAHLKAHPDAPRSKKEQELSALRAWYFHQQKRTSPPPASSGVKGHCE